MADRCAASVDGDPFHVKHGRWIWSYALSNPQARRAFYVVFHVKRSCLWITPVDNFRTRVTEKTVTIPAAES